MIKNFLLFFVFGVCFCCEHSPLTASSTESKIGVYPLDLDLTLDGEEMSGGMYVFEPKESYFLEFANFRKFLHLRITSCHRCVDISNNRKGYDYRPVPGIEDLGYCPVHIIGYDKVGRIHAGIFHINDSKTGNVDIEAKMACNGVQSTERGLAVCQSRNFLEQRITFEDDMKVLSLTPNCANWTTKDSKKFRINMSKGFCFYAFQVKEKREFFRVSTYGYQEVYIDN